MSHLIDRLQFFKKKQGEFADGHGEVSNESREWNTVIVSAGSMTK